MCTEEQNLAEVREVVRKLRPIDDTLFRKMFNENIELTQFVLRIFLDKPDLVVENVNTQFDLKKLMGARSLVLDAYATDSEGKKYNIEAEKTEDRADPHRARYHLSALDTENSKTCKEPKDLPMTYVIFITEKDIFKANEPIYPIERVNLKTGKLFNDGEHIIYINASYKDDTTMLGKLLHDFMCRDPKDMVIPEISECANEWKNTKEGEDLMCAEVEKYAKEKAEKAAEKAKLQNSIETAMSLLKLGKLTVAEIGLSTKLSVEMITQLAIDNNIAYTV